MATLLKIIIGLCIFGVFISLIMLIKNEITYKNLDILADAIYLHDMNRLINDDYENLIGFDILPNYDVVYHNLFYWGYKKLVPEDIYEKIKPYIKIKENT